MSKPAPSQQQPLLSDAEQDAISLHSTRSDYEYDDVPELPSYADSEAAAASVAVSAEHEDPALFDDYAVTNPSGSTSLQETSIRMDGRLEDPEELYRYIIDYLRVVPPSPAVKIVGTHSQTVYRDNKKQTERVTDFDILLKLNAYLVRGAVQATGGDEAAQQSTFWQPRVAGNGDVVYRGGWRKMQANGYKQDIEIGVSTPSLKDWCNDFCLSKAKLKVFRITRNVTDLDESLLRQDIQHMIRQTAYQGHIEITFPVGDKHVDIYNPRWIQRWRSSWVRFIFYVTFLWILIWPLLFFFTHRWGVYKINWRWSYIPEPESPEQRVVYKKYAVLSERAWFKKHAGLLKTLVLDGWKGDATSLPLDVQSRTERRNDGRLPSRGSANVDSAVNTIQGGIEAWNSLSGRAGGTGGWGGDSQET